MTRLPGSKLGPYEILEPVGAGGMGEVYKARDTRLGRIVAIKKVKEQHSERFKQEARSIAALNHQNICQLHDIGPDYLVLEYVDGKPLSSPLPEKEAVRLAVQVATALEAAHKKNIIHRDLKPSNIMVTDEGSVKLLDFGLAKLYEQDAAISTSPTADFPATQAGAVLGTIAYMSPEQAQGQPADARSDIFSFGLVLYEMLSGRRAFAVESPVATALALVKDEPPSIQASPSLERIVRRCLMKQPSDRYQTMSEVKTALEQVFAEKVTPGSAESQPSIAVLPFVNMSGDREQEYFSDGLAEEIINVLAHIEGLRVSGRTSSFYFRGKDVEFAEIGRRLNVGQILEGSVRKAGNRIRVTAQLVKVSDGFHLWSERYDRDLTDIFAIQDEIATAIANALRLNLPAVPRRSYEPKLAAHEAYLKARYLWGRLAPEAVSRAKEYLEQAIALDPQYALAHCGLADQYLALTSAGLMPSREAMSIVRKEARRALDINPSLAEARAILAVVAGVYDYDWKEAERQFRVAMAHDPVPARVRQWYGYFYLLPAGRVEESIDQQEQGVKGDPLNVNARVSLAVSLLAVGRWADGHAEALKALEFDENKAWSSAVLTFTYAHQGKWAEALNSAQKASSKIPWALGCVTGVMRRMGEKSRAEELIQQLMQREPLAAAYGLVCCYILAGEVDTAADWAEKVIELRHPAGMQLASIYIKTSPRWPTIAKLMNLPEEAR